MKTLLKIYSASCFIFVGFLLFFAIPFESSPLSGAWTAMVSGALILMIVATYVVRLHRREGIEFGWFLANKGGLWFITAACFGFVLVLSGLMIHIAPLAVEPAFERGSWPVAGGLIVLFWLALIYMFAFLSFGMVARVTALFRIVQIKKALSSMLLAALCLVIAGVFFSLFLEVINDNFFRISATAQWWAIWVFVGFLTVGGIVHAMWENVSYYLEPDEVGRRAGAD